jgi:serine/threonine protein kinase
MSQFPFISGYQVLEIAGRGGMSTVYRAIQLDTGREVALKLILSTKQDWLAQFGKEAKIIASLEHPHILPVYDFGTSGGQLYLVMRLLEGGSLSDWVKENRKPNPDKVVEAIISMADALDFSHAQGILHRDVKPSNMLVDQNGFVYLSDFGLAVFPSDGEQHGLGSASYISPEQAKGGEIDGRADVYSLSVTLFELLTGEKPYTAETAVGVIVKQVNEPVPYARDINPEITRSMADLIQWGMSKEAEDRPQSAGQFKELLQYANRNPDGLVRAFQMAGSSPVLTVKVKPEGFVENVVSADHKTNNRSKMGKGPIIWIALVLLLVASAAVLVAIWFVYFYPDVVPAISTPAPAIITQSAPLQTTIPTVGNEKLIYIDTFDVETPTNNLEKGTAFVKGALQIQPESQETLLWVPDIKSDISDGLFSIDIVQSNRAENYQIGIVCRRAINGDAFDFIGVYVEKTENIQTVSSIKIQNGVQTFLDTDEIPEELKITDTGSHQLEIRCVKNEIEFFIDDALVLSSRDNDPIVGGFGIFTANLTDGVHVVQFDNAKIETP